MVARTLVIATAMACSPGPDGPAPAATPTGAPADSPVVTASPVTPAATGTATTIATLPPSPPLTQRWSATAAADVPFSFPDGVAIDPVGNAFVLDSGNNRVVKLDPDGRVLATWGRFGRAAGEFDCTGFCMIAVDPAGRVVVTDHGNARVQVFDSDGAAIDAWGTLGSAKGEFDGPFGIAVDRDGNVYVGEVGNHRVQKFTADGTALLAFGTAGTGEGQFSDDIADLAVDAAGTIYVTDRSLGVQRFDPTGRFLGALGGCGDGRGLGSATGIAIDGDGVLVFNLQSRRLCRFDRDGNASAWWDASGSPDGPFADVGGVAAGPSGMIVVGELFRRRVRAFSQP